MRKDILIILSMFLIAFLIRVVGVANVCMYGDEWLYLVDTNRLLANNFAPRADVFDFAPPFLPYIGAIFTLLFEGDLNNLRMISVIFGSLTVPMLYLFGKAMYDRKTGLLAAFLLCFSAYHCLYSRIYMLEALTLFFITAFLYFFWLSQRSEQKKKSTTYAIIAGAMLGLSFDAKYISMFLVPAILIYVLWTKRFSFKALMDKQIVLISIFAFLFLSPILICLYTTGIGLHPFYYMAIEKFDKLVVGHTRTVGLPIYDLFIGGGGKMLEVLSTWGAEILNPPWSALFKLSAILLFLIIVFYYLHNFANREERGSFLIISIFVVCILLLVIGRMRHYLIYLLPFYFVMLSHLAVKTFEHIKREKKYKNIFRTFIIVLVSIVLFSSFIIGVTSHHWDEGDSYSWVKSAVEYVKTDVTKSGYKEPILIGVVDYATVPLDYSLYLSDIDVSTIPVIKFESKYARELVTMNLDRINMLKPYYLIASEDFYKQYFRENVEREIFKDYKIVFHSQTYPHTCFVLKRKDMQQPELSSQMDGKEGKISKDMFERSVLGVMKVGKAYTALVQVKNTGDSHADFTVIVHSDKFIIFVDEECRSVTLDKGSIRTLKFKIVPFRKYTGELPITVDLYAKDEENETYRKVDSSTDYVRLIKK